MPAQVNKPGSCNSARNIVTQTVCGSNSFPDYASDDSSEWEEPNIRRMRLPSAEVVASPQPTRPGIIASRNGSADEAAAPKQGSADVSASSNRQQSCVQGENQRLLSENQRLLAKSSEDDIIIADLQRKAQENRRLHEAASMDQQALKKQLREAIASNEQLNVDIKILQNENVHLRAEAINDDASIRSLHDELDEARTLSRRADAKCAQLALDLQRSRAECAAEISLLRKQLDESEAKVAERTSKVIALEQQLSEAEARTAQLQETHSKSVQERCQLRQQTNKAKHDLKSEQTKFERESKVVKELQTEVGSLKKRLAMNSQDCASCYLSFSSDDVSKHKLALIPCGHCLCRSCVQAIEAVATGTGMCPFCDTTIKGKLRLHE